MKPPDNSRMKISADLVLVTTPREHCNVRSTRCWEVDPRHVHPSAMQSATGYGPVHRDLSQIQLVLVRNRPVDETSMWRCQCHTRTEVDDDMRPGIQCHISSRAGSFSWKPLYLGLATAEVHRNAFIAIVHRFFWPLLRSWMT